MPDIFISYSRDDSLAMEVIVSNLRKLGFDIWVDIEHLKPGTPQWQHAVKEAVLRVDGLIVLCSPFAEQSHWVGTEVSLALEAGKPILPILIQGTQIDAIPFALFSYQYCDMRGRADRHRGFREVIEWLVTTFEYDVPDYEFDSSVREALPTIQVINVSGHVEGHVVGITGDVQGEVNVAGRDIVKTERPFRSAFANRLPDLTRAVLAVLPEPFEWCEVVSNSSFQLQTALGVIGTYSIVRFYMAKYPITWEQFQVFVDDPQGFRNPDWWQGLSADDDHRQQPGQQEFTYAANLPRETVSWYDAVAFCRWLSARTGKSIRLPTEWQWQWAAQGSDGRSYPWGDVYIPEYANANEVLDRTTPVGSYPQGASPFGVLDMSGNVWEWCLNEYENPDHIDVAGEADRVARGGSWGWSDLEASATWRDSRTPDLRGKLYGFRVVHSYLE